MGARLALVSFATLLLWGCGPSGTLPLEDTFERPGDGAFAMGTWNVRGYPEKTTARAVWFSETLAGLALDTVCIQEISNDGRVEEFLDSEATFTQAAFFDTSDGQDNAIFAADWVTLDDIDDPEGFLHPAQAAYIAYEGFDAVVVTIHLAWSDLAQREAEKALLLDVIADATSIDPDVIIAGDFNTTEADMEALADWLGMYVLVPPGQDGVGTTHAGNRYDHFLVSPDCYDEEYITSHIILFPGDALAEDVSDHVPVVAWFSTDLEFKDRPD